MTHSEVGESRDSDGVTYYPDIRFRYQVDDQVHDTGTYRIQQISSSGRSGKLKIVRQYPVGAEVQAWYDPDDVTMAVLDTSFSFFPVIFLAVGLVMLAIIVGIWVFHLRRSSASASVAAWAGTALAPATGSFGPRQNDVGLKPQSGSAGGLVGMALFCLFWNGITYGIATALWFMSEDTIPFFAKAILVLFMAIGAFLVVAVIMQAMARMKLFPPQLVASVQPVHLGERFNIQFQQRAKAPVHIDCVTAKLICRESATYRRGTDTTTVTRDVYEDVQEFAHDSAADSLNPIETALSFQVPDDGMHSFRADRNRIDWLLHVKTAVADWPDYAVTFELQVAPKRARVEETN